VAFSPQANYTDWTTATFRRNLVPNFADRGVSRGHRGGIPTAVNLSFIDQSRYFYCNFINLPNLSAALSPSVFQPLTQMNIGKRNFKKLLGTRELLLSLTTSPSGSLGNEGSSTTRNPIALCMILQPFLYARNPAYISLSDLVPLSWYNYLHLSFPRGVFQVYEYLTSVPETRYPACGLRSAWQVNHNLYC
jgi:hypothetical protein